MHAEAASPYHACGRTSLARVGYFAGRVSGDTHACVGIFVGSNTLDFEAVLRTCAEALRVELECRQEEDESAVSLDLATASKKSMAKVVNQVRR